jgi:hypothetical protein
MTNIIRDRLDAGGVDYEIDVFPLDALLAAFPDRPREAPTLWRQNGYVADWAIVDGVLVLTRVSRESIARLFAEVGLPMGARWFSGYLRAWRGERRRTGYPPRTFFDDELVFEIEAGRVTRSWTLDLRGVRGQTAEEVRLSLPRFLWPKTGD